MPYACLPYDSSDARAVALVDLGALRRNLRALKSLLPACEFMAVLKGNAYGHGAVPVARAAIAAGADRIGVATVGEAVEMRQAGISCPIHVLGGVLPWEAAAAVESDVILSVGSNDELNAITSAACQARRKVVVHIKVDTGLHRLGVAPDAFMGFVREVFNSAWVVPEGVYTHLACADEGDQRVTDHQVSLFLRLVEQAASAGYRFRMRHVAASTLSIERPDLAFDMVRVGVALYGIYPHPRLLPRVALEPVITLKAPVLQIREVAPGDGIGYGYTFRAEGPMRVATLAVGFADGYPRSLGNRGWVLLKGRRARIVGSISMDHTLVDVTQVPGVAAGAEAVLVGGQGGERIRAEEVATWGGTIPDEIVAGLTGRVQRVYIGENSLRNQG